MTRKTGSILGALFTTLALSLTLTACGADAGTSAAEQAVRNGAASSTAKSGSDDKAKGQACSAAAPCPTGQECDDGFCKAHGGDGSEDCDSSGSDDASIERRGRGGDDPGQVCGAIVCPKGQECEHGVCKPHRG